MNNNTNSNGVQGSGLNADEIASSLAFATHLGEQSLPKDVPKMEQPMEEMPMEETPEASQEPAPEQEEVPVEEYLTDMEVRMDEKLESFKEEILKTINK